VIYDTRWHATLPAAAAFAKRLTRVNKDIRYVIESWSPAGHTKFCVDRDDRVRAWERVVEVWESGRCVWIRPANPRRAKQEDLSCIP